METLYFFRRHSGVILGISGILLGAFYLYETTQIKVPKLGDLLGPKFFPYILGILFVLCSGVFLMREIYKLSKKPRSCPPIPRSFIITFLGAWSLLIAYVWAVDFLGFIISAFLFIFLFLTLTRHGTRWARFGWAMFLTASFFTVFQVWLDIPLPSGQWPFFNV